MTSTLMGTPRPQLGENCDVASAGCAGAGVDAAGCGQVASDSPQTGEPVQGASDAGCAAGTGAERGADERSPPQTLREFERALRTLGFSRHQAERIARHGFAGQCDERVAQPQEHPSPLSSKRLHDAAQRLERTLKGFK